MAKRRKPVKRKGRFATFTGSTVKHLRGDRTTTVQFLEHEGEERVTVKSKTVFVGVQSFTKGVVNTGRGPNAERMQEYYNRVPKESYKTLADYFGITKDIRYAQLWWETPPTNRINLISDEMMRLDLFWHGTNWFFIDLDFVKRTIRRSRDYGSRQFALSCLNNRVVEWEDEIPMIQSLR